MEAYREVRLQALCDDPDAFLTTAADFAARPLQSVADRLEPTAHAVTFGAVLDGTLVGLLTLVREKSAVLAHRANVYGVSVAPAARGQGVGAALLDAAVAHARTWNGVHSLHLAVIETQAAARRLYERHGFRVWGRQPDAVCRDGALRAEDWMWWPPDPGGLIPAE